MPVSAEDRAAALAYIAERATQSPEMDAWAREHLADIDPDTVQAYQDRLDDELLARAGIITLSDVDPERVDWLWKPWLPLGKVVILDGDPGCGKSTLCLDLSARITTGSPMPNRATNGLRGPADVVYLSAEDGVGDTIRPRFAEVAGGDPKRFHLLDTVRYEDEEGREHTRLPTLPGDVGLLGAMVRRYRAKLVVVDVLFSYLNTKDSNSDAEIRKGLHPLTAMAAMTGCCIIALRHLRKSGGKAIYAGGGSIGTTGNARVQLVAGRDPTDEAGERLLLAQGKNNLAPIPSAVVYGLAGNAEWECASVRYGGTSSLSADELLVPPDTGGATNDDAVSVLRKMLNDAGGSMPVQEAKAAMKEADFSPDQARRAKDKIARAVKYGKPGDTEQGWRWVLHATERDAQAAIDSEGGEDGEPGMTPPPAIFDPTATESVGIVEAHAALPFDDVVLEPAHVADLPVTTEVATDLGWMEGGDPGYGAQVNPGLGPAPEDF